MHIQGTVYMRKNPLVGVIFTAATMSDTSTEEYTSEEVSCVQWPVYDINMYYMLLQQQQYNMLCYPTPNSDNCPTHSSDIFFDNRKLYNAEKLCDVIACFYPFSNTLENIGSGNSKVYEDAIIFYPFDTRENTYGIKITIERKIHDNPRNRRQDIHGYYEFNDPDHGDYISSGEPDDTDYSDDEHKLPVSINNNKKNHKKIILPICISIPYLSDPTIFVAKIMCNTHIYKNTSDFVFKFTLQ